jgi:hypothetical protein
MNHVTPISSLRLTPQWPGHKPAQLYVVIQEPRREHRGQWSASVWFTTANDKTHAAKLFADLCPDYALPGGVYKKPTAHLVTTGGNALRV